MATYYAVIHKDKDSDYGVSFPDVPGCISAGSTLEEAEVMAKEALAFHIDGMKEDGEKIPAPTTDFKAVYEEYCNDKDFHSLMLVTLQEKVKKVRVNISVPEQDLKLIDTVADKHGMDRSAFLVLAAKKIVTGSCEL
ncbi:type II toxin-antitoxin system HicB family antitoxin [Maridesulfovibrio bastinii]|uniref:type II toxin-antitoxin system HicB family antitoxin n=1 Tax=Maridesulfovibrio bastinii TaxID=47157 RepID=UPI00040024DC|nr:type II toxin-antitoxin system HicB family antitoxin [Maridesulfovibrio bastinii]